MATGDKYNGEKVLVFPKTLFKDLGYFNGTCTETKRYMDEIFKEGNNHFHLRIDAENDPSLKQIIPYVVFRAGDKVFSYVRGKKAGETRLVGNRSIGIGGHVNPIDSQTADVNGEIQEDMATYLEAVKREIEEEVVVRDEISPEIAVLLNDDSNDVGKVHFGVIHICHLNTESVSNRESQISESGFIAINELAGSRREELESWSQIAIDYLVSQGE